MEDLDGLVCWFCYLLAICCNWFAAGNKTETDSSQPYDLLNVDNGIHLPGDDLDQGAAVRSVLFNRARIKH